MIGNKLRCVIQRGTFFYPVSFNSPYTSGALGLTGIEVGQFAAVSGNYPYVLGSGSLSVTSSGTFAAVSFNNPALMGSLALSVEYSDDFTTNKFTGGPWTTMSGLGALTTSSGQAVSTSSSGIQGAYYSGGTFNADQWVEAKAIGISTSSVYHRLVLRAQTSANTYYMAGIRSGSTSSMYRVMNGNPTPIGSGFTVNEGDVVRFQIIGSTLTVSLNGTAVQSTTDSNIATGYPGIVLSGTAGNANRWDDFKCGNI